MMIVYGTVLHPFYRCIYVCLHVRMYKASPSSGALVSVETVLGQGTPTGSTPLGGTDLGGENRTWRPPVQVLEVEVEVEWRWSY